MISPASAGTPLTHDLLGDRLQLQVGRAFVDLADLGVAVELLDRILLDESVAAEQVDRERRDALGDLRRQDLADRGFGEERLAGVAQTGGVVDGQRRAASTSTAARAIWCWTAWNSAIALPNCLPLFRVGDRRVERAAREADHLRADADASFVERLDRDLVALADLAEDVRRRHPAVLEDQLAGAAGADAELVFLLADGEPGDAALDEERSDAAVAGVRDRPSQRR